MTVIEKVALQKKSFDTVFLFKEGLYYKVYNEGIYHLQFLDCNIRCRFKKKINDFVFSIRFGQEVLDTLKVKFKMETKGDFLFFKSFDNFYDSKDYQKWKNNFVKESDTLSLNNKDLLFDVVKNYPIGMKSPVDVFIWVSELQQKIVNNK